MVKSMKIIWLLCFQDKHFTNWYSKYPKFKNC